MQPCLPRFCLHPLTAASQRLAQGLDPTRQHQKPPGQDSGGQAWGQDLKRQYQKPLVLKSGGRVEAFTPRCRTTCQPVIELDDVQTSDRPKRLSLSRHHSDTATAGGCPATPQQIGLLKPKFVAASPCSWQLWGLPAPRGASQLQLQLPHCRGSRSSFCCLAHHPCLWSRVSTNACSECFRFHYCGVECCQCRPCTRTWLPFSLRGPIAAGWVLVAPGGALCSSLGPAALPRRGAQRAGAVEEDVFQLQRRGGLALQQLCRHRERQYQFCGAALHLLAVPTSASRAREECVPFSSSAAGVLQLL